MIKFIARLSRLPLATLLILAALLPLLPACQGGGGGTGAGTAGAGGITYAGLTTPVSLTASNANIMFSAMWNGGYPSGAASLSPAVSKAAPSGYSQDNGIVSFARQMRGRLSDNVIRFSTQAKSMKSAAPINNTYYGKVSGTETDTGSIDPNTGTGTVTATYVNFNDGDGYTYDGAFTVTIDAYDMVYGIMTDWTMSCTLWTIKSAGSDVSLSGSIRERKSLQNKSETLTMNVDGRDNIGNETFRFENYVVTTVSDDLLNPTSGTETYSGRMYVEKYGYVDISTISPCIYSGSSGDPDSGGPIVLAGAGNATVRIIPLSASYVKIEVDAEGDAAFEYGQVYAWNNLGGAPASSGCIANAGQDQTALIGSPVTLDGSGSMNLNGGSLTYDWTMTAKPLGSSAVLSGPSETTASFTADMIGRYTITLVVSNGTTSSDPDTVVVAATGVTGIPTNVKATGENGQVDVSWSPVTDATSYNIYWSTTAANANKASGTKITGIRTIHYVHAGLANGTPYYYAVTATGPFFGEGAESSPISSAIPGGFVTAAPGNGQATVNWTAVTGATSYNIYWSTTAANATPLSGAKITNAASPHVHAGLTNGTVYYYLVTAVASDGEITISPPVAARPGTYLMGGAVQGFPLTLSNTEAPFAGQDSALGSTDGTASTAAFDGATGLTTDGVNLYVADSSNHTIRKIVISTGVVSTIAGQADVSGAADGTDSSARFNYPASITTDGTNLYVVDTLNRTIRKIVISTGMVITLAGTAGVSGSTDGIGSAAKFYFAVPGGGYNSAITTDGNNLYVTDTINNTIRKIVISTGEVTTLAGTAWVTGSADGTGSAARFTNPAGITTDGTNLYVADTLNSTIRKIVISTGVVTTLAGTAGLTGLIDGIGSSAYFERPQGLTTDGTNLFVADTINHAIRKIIISTSAVSTLVPLVFPNGITTDGVDLFVFAGGTMVEKIQ